MSLKRNTHKTRLSIGQVAKNVVIRDLQVPNRVFPLGIMVQYSLIHCFQSLYRTSLLQIMRINFIFCYFFKVSSQYYLRQGQLMMFLVLMTLVLIPWDSNSFSLQVLAQGMGWHGHFAWSFLQWAATFTASGEVISMECGSECVSLHVLGVGLCD